MKQLLSNERSKKCFINIFHCSLSTKAIVGYVSKTRHVCFFLIRKTRLYDPFLPNRINYLHDLRLCTGNYELTWKKKMYIRMTIPNYVNDLLKSELVAGNAWAGAPNLFLVSPLVWSFAVILLTIFINIFWNGALLIYPLVWRNT